MEKTTKRSFLKTAATVGGAAAVSAQTAKTETAQARTAQAKRLQHKRKSPSSVELIEWESSPARIIHTSRASGDRS